MFVGANSYPGQEGTNPFDGLIDEVKIYPYALNQDEINKLYNHGKVAVLGGAKTESDGTTKTRSKSREYCVPGDTSTCDPPVLELKMNEKNGANVYDTSGNGNDGAITDATWARGKYGSALSFDGTNDYIQYTDSSLASNFPGKNGSGTTSEITIETWAFLKDNYIDIICKYSGSFCFWFDASSRLRITTPDGTVYTSSLSIQNEWKHLAMTTAGTNANFYVDGNLEATESFAYEIRESSSTFYVGSSGGTADMNGYLDDVRIYNYARTPAQIAMDYNGGKPIAYYKFDECSGSTIHDESGNGNHGALSLGSGGVTATGTCASSSDSFWYNGRSGKRQSSGDFDGTDDSVDLGVNAFGDLGDTHSVGAWFKVTGNGIILSEYESGVCGDFFLRSSSGLLVAHDGGSESLYSKTIINDNVWHHGVFVSDVNTSYMYIDGELDNSGADVDWGNNCSTQEVRVGNVHGSSNWLNGQLDEVKIWNYALTAEQVKSDYNGGAVKFGE